MPDALQGYDVYSASTAPGPFTKRSGRPLQDVHTGRAEVAVPPHHRPLLDLRVRRD